MIDLEQLTSSLKTSGLRLTPQRWAVCRYLSETETHPTAATVYEALKPEMPSLSLMTVYNTLNALAELGAIRAIGQAGDDTVHYDTHTAPHVNLVCVACHKIVDVPSDKITPLTREIEGKSGFNLTGSRLVFEGLCPDCQQKQEKKK